MGLLSRWRPEPATDSEDVVARPGAKGRPTPKRSEARAQLAAALARHGVEPRAVGLFGGRVDPSHLHFPFSKMPPGDARDWSAIAAWGEALPEALGFRELPVLV